MRTLALLSFLLSATAFAQPTAFRIVSVSPSIGSVGGGDLVRITVDQFPSGCDPAACEQIARVTFGDTSARSIKVDGNFVTVVTPAHASGKVDVTMTVGSASTLPGAFMFIDMNSAQMLSPTNYEKILIPVAIQPGATVPGAYGSQWESELWALNDGPFKVEFFTGFPGCILLNPVGCPGMQFPFIDANALRRIGTPDDGQHAAYVFYLQKGEADQVTFSNRIRDISRSTQNAGTELPVVHEREFKTQIDLINVPVDRYSRTSLRIYDPDGAESLARVVFVPTVNPIVPAPGDIPLYPAIDIQLKVKGSGSATNGFLYYAGYAFIPDVRALLPTLPDDKYMVLVRSNSGVPWRMWAMATVANNDTQLVTVVAPQ